MCNALSTYLDHDNACAVFAAADSYQCEGLKVQAFGRIVQHFALATRSEGWIALTKEQLSEVRAACGRAGCLACLALPCFVPRV